MLEQTAMAVDDLAGQKSKTEMMVANLGQIDHDQTNLQTAKDKGHRGVQTKT